MCMKADESVVRCLGLGCCDLGWSGLHGLKRVRLRRTKAARPTTRLARRRADRGKEAEGQPVQLATGALC